MTRPRGRTAACTPDAACCVALGRRPRGADHHQAVALLESVAKGGSDMAKDLERLLSVKDNAHYGNLSVAGPDAERAVQWARRLVDGAAAIVDR